jgi:hypothetical protein
LKKANNPGQSDQLLSDDSDEEMTNESDRIPEIVQNQTIYKINGKFVPINPRHE